MKVTIFLWFDKKKYAQIYKWNVCFLVKQFYVLLIFVAASLQLNLCKTATLK